MKRLGTSRFFKESSGQVRNWDQCKAKAAELGYTFASIHSDEERDAILAANDVVMWCGGRRVGPGTAFEWDDGTPFDYQTWSSGEPSSNEDGIMINWGAGTGNWNDAWKPNSAPCLYAEPVGRLSHNFIPFSFFF